MKGIPYKWERMRQQVHNLVDCVRKERILSRTWLHCDMDMFFAAVEIRDDPSLADKPVAVGDQQMIQTTNYLARNHGIKSGMPGFIGKKLCKDLVFIKPNYIKYRAASDKMKEVLMKYDEQLESLGLDEASIDITQYLIDNGLNSQEGKVFIGQKIRQEILDQVGLTASSGIACNKLLAKICADMNKPNGVTYLNNTVEEIINFMMPQPVRKIPGIGKINEMILSGIGITQCSDILEKACEIYINFSPNAFQFLIQGALGITRVVHENCVQKSIGVSKTFSPITAQ